MNNPVVVHVLRRGVRQYVKGGSVEGEPTYLAPARRSALDLSTSSMGSS